MTHRNINHLSTDDQLGVDWQRIGKIHDPNSALDEVISKEVIRLQKALDIKMDEVLDEVFLKKTGDVKHDAHGSAANIGPKKK